jgi:hypothetical protein
MRNQLLLYACGVPAMVFAAGCGTDAIQIQQTAAFRDRAITFDIAMEGGKCVAKISPTQRDTAYPGKKVAFQVTNKDCPDKTTVVVSFSPFAKDLEFRIKIGETQTKSIQVRSEKLKKKTEGAYKYDIYVGDSSNEPNVDPEIEIDW